MLNSISRILLQYVPLKLNIFKFKNRSLRVLSLRTESRTVHSFPIINSDQKSVQHYLAKVLKSNFRQCIIPLWTTLIQYTWSVGAETVTVAEKFSLTSDRWWE